MKQNTTKFESKKLSRCRRRQKRRFDVFGEAIVDQHLPHADHFAAVGDQEIDGHLEKTGPVETLLYWSPMISLIVLDTEEKIWPGPKRPSFLSGTSTAT